MAAYVAAAGAEPGSFRSSTSSFTSTRDVAARIASGSVPTLDERMLLRLRTAVGNGNELVNLAGTGDFVLGDDEVKVLVRMLMETEAAAKERVRAAEVAKDALERAREEDQIPDFNAFLLDSSAADPAQIAYEAGCFVVWPDDPILAQTTVAFAKANDDGEQLSYRFTPRSQRTYHLERKGGGGASRHSAGRAKVLFRAALSRHSLQQKALWAEAMKAEVALEEAGMGCQHLSLQNNELGSRGTAHLTSYIRSTLTLKTLALGKNAIGDAGATLLGRALSHSRSLETLGLQGCSITPKGIRHLAAGLGHNRSLKSLWLFGNDSSDEGAAHIAAALSSCELISLGLEMNEIHTMGAEALAFALSSEDCPLRWLRLQHNPLGDSGVSALAHALYKNRSLTKLQLRDTGVREAGCAELAKVLPKHRALHTLGLEQNDLPATATDPLLRAMRASASLATISLDLQHGGDYTKMQTAEELVANFTVTMLAGKKRPNIFKL